MGAAARIRRSRRDSVACAATAVAAHRTRSPATAGEREPSWRLRPWPLQLLVLVLGTCAWAVRGEVVFPNERTFTFTLSTLAADGVTHVPFADGLPPADHTVPFRPAAFGGAVHVPAPATALTVRLLLAETDDRGCAAPPNATHHTGTGVAWAGAAVLVARGSCGYALKAFTYQSVGAALVLIHNSCSSTSVSACLTDTRLLTPLGGLGPGTSLTVPALFIRYGDGQALRDRLAHGGGAPVFVTVAGTDAIDAADLSPVQTLAAAYGAGMAASAGISSFYGNARPWSDLTASSGGGLDPCRFRLAGIWCEGGRVVSIYWDTLGVAGALHPAFGALTALRQLVVINSALTGPVPCALTGATALRFVDLTAASSATGLLSSLPGSAYDGCNGVAGLTALQYFGASFQSLTNLPAEWLVLPRLELLVLDHNAITSLPPVVAPSAHNATLAYLTLDSNRLRGTLPPLQALPALATLLLGGNALSGTVVHALDGLTQLTNVGLSHNAFTGPLPELRGCTALTSLDVSYNAFEGVPPASWAGLQQLTTLLAAHNAIAAPLSAQGQLSSPVLATVDLSWNNVTARSGNAAQDSQAGVAAAFLWSVGSSALRVLNLAHNDLRGSWGAGYTSGWPALTKLDLSWNAITALPSDLFSSALFTTATSSLQTFDVSFNALTGSLPATAPPVASLQLLALSGNAGLVGPQLPPWIVASTSSLSKSVGTSYYCPALVVPANPNLVVSLDGSYYAYSLCTCDSGRFGTPPDCTDIPSVVDTSRPLAYGLPHSALGVLLFNRTDDRAAQGLDDAFGFAFTDSWYGNQRQVPGTQTAWILPAFNDSRADPEAAAAGAPASARRVRTVTLRLWFWLDAWQSASDVLTVYAGAGVTGTRVAVFTGSDPLDPATDLDAYTGRPVAVDASDGTHNVTVVERYVRVVQSKATLQFQTRDLGGQHFNATYAVSSVCPDGYEIDDETDECVETEPPSSFALVLIVIIAASVVVVLLIFLLVRARRTVLKLTATEGREADFISAATQWQADLKKTLAASIIQLLFEIADIVFNWWVFGSLLWSLNGEVQGNFFALAYTIIIIPATIMAFENVYARTNECLEVHRELTKGYAVARQTAVRTLLNSHVTDAHNVLPAFASKKVELASQRPQFGGVGGPGGARGKRARVAPAPTETETPGGGPSGGQAPVQLAVGGDSGAGAGEIELPTATVGGLTALSKDDPRIQLVDMIRQLKSLKRGLYLALAQDVPFLLLNAARFVYQAEAAADTDDTGQLDVVALLLSVMMSSMLLGYKLTHWLKVRQLTARRYALERRLRRMVSIDGQTGKAVFNIPGAVTVVANSWKFTKNLKRALKRAQDALAARRLAAGVAALHLSSPTKAGGAADGNNGNNSSSSPSGGLARSALFSNPSAAAAVLLASSMALTVKATDSKHSGHSGDKAAPPASSSVPPSSASAAAASTAAAKKPADAAVSAAALPSAAAKPVTPAPAPTVPPAKPPAPAPAPALPPPPVTRQPSAAPPSAAATTAVTEAASPTTVPPRASHTRTHTHTRSSPSASASGSASAGGGNPFLAALMSSGGGAGAGAGATVANHHTSGSESGSNSAASTPAPTATQPLLPPASLSSSSAAAQPLDSPMDSAVVLRRTANSRGFLSTGAVVRGATAASANAFRALPTTPSVRAPAPAAPAAAVDADDWNAEAADDADADDDAAAAARRRAADGLRSPDTEQRARLHDAVTAALSARRVGSLPSSPAVSAGAGASLSPGPGPNSAANAPILGAAAGAGAAGRLPPLPRRPTPPPLLPDSDDDGDGGSGGGDSGGGVAAMRMQPLRR